jgi:hypothetical protein
MRLVMNPEDDCGRPSLTGRIWLQSLTGVLMLLRMAGPSIHDAAGWLDLRFQAKSKYPIRPSARHSRMLLAGIQMS